MNSRSMYAVRLALIVSMGGFIFGFDASIISGAVPFLLEDFGLSDWELGLVVAAPTLGGIISGALAGPLSDRFGRKIPAPYRCYPLRWLRNVLGTGSQLRDTGYCPFYWRSRFWLIGSGSHIYCRDLPLKCSGKNDLHQSVQYRYRFLCCLFQ